MVATLTEVDALDPLPTLTEFAGVVASELGIPGIAHSSIDTELRSVEGFDSLAAVELVAFVEERWGLEVPEAMLGSLLTIRDWHDLLVTRLDAEPQNRR